MVSRETAVVAVAVLVAAAAAAAAAAVVVWEPLPTLPSPPDLSSPVPRSSCTYWTHAENTHRISVCVCFFY